MHGGLPERPIYFSFFPSICSTCDRHTLHKFRSRKMGSEQSKMTNDTLNVCCAPIKVSQLNGCTLMHQCFCSLLLNIELPSLLLHIDLPMFLFSVVIDTFVSAYRCSDAWRHQRPNSIATPFSAAPEAHGARACSADL